jgi:glucan phosphoethanolaminetransferase (alkaline phosphatase superfamily)
MNVVWFILVGVVFAIVYCYFVSLFLLAVGRAVVKRLNEKTMDKTKEWYFSWPAIVVGLLVVQLFVQCYLAKLPDTPSTSELFDGMLLLYMVFAALVVVGKRERDSYRKSQERPRHDAEKQRLVGRVDEP